MCDCDKLRGTYDESEDVKLNERNKNGYDLGKKGWGGGGGGFKLE